MRGIRTTKILIKSNKPYECHEFFVHDVHESDLTDFLENHPKREMVSDLTRSTEGADWFSVDLTKKDIETIKETCWYKNTSWDFKELESILDNAKEVEVFFLEYIPRE